MVVSRCLATLSAKERALGERAGWEPRKYLLFLPSALEHALQSRGAHRLCACPHGRPAVPVVSFTLERSPQWSRAFLEKATSFLLPGDISWEEWARPLTPATGLLRSRTPPSIPCL